MHTQLHDNYLLRWTLLSDEYMTAQVTETYSKGEALLRRGYGSLIYSQGVGHINTLHSSVTPRSGHPRICALGSHVNAQKFQPWLVPNALYTSAST